MDNSGNAERVGWSTPPDQRPESRPILTLFLCIALFLLHALWCCYIDGLIFRLCEGRSQRTSFLEIAGVEIGWINSLYSPGGMAMRIADEGEVASQVFGKIALVLLFGGSAMASYSVSSSVTRALSHTRPVFGKRRWRLWVAVAGWLVWIPVPVKWSLIYWMVIAPC